MSTLTDRCATEAQRLAAVETETGRRACARCGESKPLDEYHRDRTCRLGWSYACKACLLPEKRVMQTRYRRANPEKALAAVRAQQARPDWNERRRATYGINPGPILACNSAARALRAGAEGSHTEAEWEALLVFLGGRCLACHDGYRRVERDHVVPITLGGSDSIDNLQPLCRSCNARKSNRSVEDYRPCF